MVPIKAKTGSRKTAKTISEKVHEQLAVKANAAPLDDDEDEDTRPRFSEFDENEDELVRSASGRLSEIRKQNIRYLDAIDRKYQGQISTRGDVYEESDDAELEEASGESDVSEGGHQPGAFVKLRPSSSVGSDVEYEDHDEDEDDDDLDEDEDDEDLDEEEDDDYSLGDFLGTTSSESQKLLEDENRQESVQKGICVQNQLKMWERLLEMRIKMQSGLITSNSFPHADKFNHFYQDATFQQATDKTIKTVESTLRNLLEMQDILLHSFPESKNVLSSSSKRKLKTEFKSNVAGKLARLDEYESVIGHSYQSFTPYRNEVLQKWHDRTKTASSSVKNANQTLSIVKKIENALLSKEEVVRKSQLYRGGYKLFEEPTKTKNVSMAEDDAEDDANPAQVYDEEIYDDSDFYHALLRELIEYKSSTAENPQEIGAKLAELQKLRNKMKKQVDTRASKGRKIRYVVHKKLVNFTAPDDSHQWTEEAKDELFSSLFGRTGSE
ncbi:protein Aatf [Armigeres subalbatus]|uniref:protein Aatf n=1 Tax=Armigeres subalbatus TaxID=124917 RepID=UPI002ED1946B